MKDEMKKLASTLRSNDLCVFLKDDDVLEVTRNTKDNLNPGHTQHMTVSDAVNYGAWDEAQGTMSTDVQHEGSSVRLLRGRAYKIVDTGEQPAWVAEAHEPRDTLTCWTYR
jgi:hypothetical protein